MLVFPLVISNDNNGSTCHHQQFKLVFFLKKVAHPLGGTH